MEMKITPGTGATSTKAILEIMSWYKCNVCHIILQDPVAFTVHIDKHKKHFPEHVDLFEIKTGLVPLNELVGQNSMEIFIPKISMRPLELSNQEYSTKIYSPIVLLNSFEGRINSKYVDEQKIESSTSTQASGVISPAGEMSKIESNVHSNPTLLYCRICRLGVSESKQLGHMERHIISAEYFPCCSCSAVFSESAALRLHEIHQHNFSNKYSCKQCAMTFITPKFLKNHILKTCVKLINEPNLIPCPDCPARFNKPRALGRHLREQHDALQYGCRYCGKTYATLSTLRNHMRLNCVYNLIKSGNVKPFYLTEDDLLNNLKNLNRKEKADVGRTSGENELHGETSRSITKLTFHEEVDKNSSSVVQSPHSPCSTKLSTSKNHIVQPKEILCPGLDKFPTLRALLRNVENEQQSKEPDRFECQYCGKNLLICQHTCYTARMCAMASTLPEYNTTSQSQATEQVEFILSDIPERAEDDFSHLTTYINSSNFIQQDSTKSFECPICKRSFGDKYKLLQHMKLHTTSLAKAHFPCQMCSCKFATSEALFKHAIHNHTRRDYKCRVCNRAYATLNSLKSHQRTHRPRIPCTLCGIKYQNNMSLKYHMRHAHSRISR